MEPLTIPVVLLPSGSGDAARTLAEEAAEALRLRGADAPIVDAEPAAGSVDGFLLLLDPERAAPPAEAGSDFTQRAIALTTIGERGPDVQAALHVTRKAYRKRGALVLERQLTLSPKAFGVYGLEDEASRERLEALLDLLLHEAERLRSDREGWE